MSIDARSEMAGTTRIAQTDLRAAGHAYVGGRRYDAITDGDDLSEDSADSVIRVDRLGGVIVRAT